MICQASSKQVAGCELYSTQRSGETPWAAQRRDLDDEQAIRFVAIHRA